MPLYEYHCSRCGKNFELRQKFSDSPLIVHDDCGGELEKVLSAPALQFKGTGWYITDYARSGSSKDSGANGKDSKDGNDRKDGKQASSESSKSDSTKSESKAESKPAASESKTSPPASDKK